MKNLKLNFLRKINIGLFLILLSVLITVKNSGAQWIQQTLPENGGTIISINFKDPNHGVIGGWTFESQPIVRGYYTTNAGVNWISSSFPDSVRAVTDIQFLSEKTGFATGAFNTYEQSMSTSHSFDYTITSVMKNNILGMDGPTGYDAILLKTTDGGISWFTFGNPNEFYSYLYQIILIDDEKALISGADQFGSYFYPGMSKTSDGGMTWERLSIPINLGDFTEIIYNNNIIYAVGYQENNEMFRGLILRSSDFGISWSKILFDDVAVFNDIKFINENTGYVGGVDQSEITNIHSSIYKTINAGSSWNRLQRVYDSTAIRGLCVKENSGNVMFYGNRMEYDDTLNVFWAKEAITGTSSNYGISWSVKTILESGLLLNSEYIDSSNIFLTGGNYNLAGLHSIVLFSTNGGFTNFNSNTLSNPDEFTLYQNYPNPFNPSTVIRYSIMSNVKGQTSNVRLVVYNNLGKDIATLVNEKQNAGSYEIKFDGSELSSGVYFYRLDSGSFSEVKKMLLVK